MQIPSKPGQSASNGPLMMTPCLEAQLKTHRIWTYPQTWLSLSQQLDITTILGIHFLQDQMSLYEIEPDLMEKVALQLVREMRHR